MGPFLYENESLASQTGVTPLATVNPIAPPPSIEYAQAIPTSNDRTGPRTASGMGAPPPATAPAAAPGTKPWSSGDNPQPDYLQQAIDIYGSMSDPTSRASSTPGYVYDGGPVAAETSWRDQIYADRAAAQRSGGSYAGGGSGQQSPSEPYQAIKAPEMPKFQGEEYAPPERDQAIYDQERRKAMGPGMRALREGTREAISSSQSLDNPNARSKFIQEALHGYGQGLESVAAGADRQATSTADRRHSEALSMYRTKYDYRRDDQLRNYQAEVSQIAADFASESAASMANYNAGFDQSGGTGGNSGARSKSTYYGNNGSQPFMGYMN